MTREQKVGAFNKAAGNTPDPETVAPHILDCIDEEVTEFFEAVDNWHTALVMGDADDVDDARRQLCKEWADMQYVISQAAWYYEIPADPAFTRVHNNNMTKVGEDGKVRRAENGKILKPADYKPVDMSGL